MPRLQYSDKRGSSTSSHESDVKRSKSRHRSPARGRSPRDRRSRSRGRRSRSRGRGRSHDRRRSPPRHRSYSRRSRSPRRRSRSRSRRRSLPRKSPRRSPPRKSPARRPSPRHSPPRKSPPRKSPLRKPSPKREPTTPHKDVKPEPVKEPVVPQRISPKREPNVSSSGQDKITPQKPSTSDKTPAPKSDVKRHGSPRRMSPSHRSRSPRRRHSRSPRRRSHSPRRKRSRSRSRTPRRRSKPDRHDDVPLKPEFRQPKHVVEEEEKMLYGDLDEQGKSHRPPEDRDTGYSRHPDRRASDRGENRPMDRDDRWQDNRGEWVKPDSGRGDKDERTQPQLITAFRPDELVDPHNPGFVFPQEPAKQILSLRFATGRYLKPFQFTENISVGIERNIRGNSPVRFKPFNAAEIIMPRRDAEGEPPLCKRDEFEEHEEYVERRVVKVLPDETRTAVLSKYEEQYQRRENFEVRSDRFQSGQEHVPLSERWKETERRSRSRSRGRAKSFEKSQGRSRDRRDGHHHRDHSREREQSRDQRVVLDRSSLRDDDPHLSLVVPKSDRDERIVAERHYGKEDLRRTIRSSDKSPEGSARYVRDPKDLRYSLVKRGRGRGSFNFDARMKIARRVDRRSMERERDGKEDLPDFSKRPDRFKDSAWVNDPSSIPKHFSYFEHDNRDPERMFKRGRGRGGFIPRGSFRGNFRGRGVFRGRGGRREYEGEWKHDKFKEVEDDQDKEPTSTTK